MKQTKTSSEDRLVEDLVTLMDRDDLPPWRKGWTGHQGNHRNIYTALEYRGANPLLLELGSMLLGHTLPLWCGAGQARIQGWFPKKGCRAVRIVRPQLNKREQTDDAGKPVLDSNGDAVVSAWISYKPVCVFNAMDLVGTDDEAQVSLLASIQAAIGAVPVAEPPARLDEAEAHLESWVVPTIFGGARACYSSSLDRIAMPSAEAFSTRETYCATWLHEQAHSTGHSSRLKRPLGNGYGTQAYAREELIAELGSVLACYRLNIGYQIENHASYLKSWSSCLKEGGAKELFKVLSEARQAADLIAPEVIEDNSTAGEYLD